MLVYHGTKANRVDSIRRDGIKPRGSGPSQWTELPSRADLVYLTIYGHFFYGRDGFGLSVVEVDLDTLDKQLLLPDEDYLHQIHRISLDEARTQLESFQNEWSDSLRTFGTCAYKGAITTESIRQVCVIDLRDSANLLGFYAGFEIMETGLETFREKGNIIGEVTQWVFNHTSTLPDQLQWDANRRSFIQLW